MTVPSFSFWTGNELRRNPLLTLNLDGNKKHFFIFPGNFAPCEDPLRKGKQNADVQI